jgi:hypothetical protein
MNDNKKININKISRFGLESFINCPRCFVMSYRYKVKASFPPFTLNNAVDNLCKNEFDIYRKEHKPHPVFIDNNLNLIPFEHENMNKWRHNFTGISYEYNDRGFKFFGAVDDVWIRPNGDLVIADVKATSVNDFNWDNISKREYGKGYQRQLEVYQFLFRKNGFKVSNSAYLLYYNGRRNAEMFNNSLSFDYRLIEIKCNDNWVENKVFEAIDLLRSDILPNGSKSCNTCQYIKDRSLVNKMKLAS